MGLVFQLEGHRCLEDSSYTDVGDGDVCLDIKETLNRVFPGFLAVECSEKLLDREEAELIDKIFSGGSDSLCIGVCDSHLKYLLREITGFACG